MKDHPSSPGRTSSEEDATNNASPIPKKAACEAEERGSMQIANATVQTQKPFTTLSAVGIGYGTTNTPVALLLIIGTTISMGGSPLVFWGFLITSFFGLCTATTLAELSSAMPHPGGQYIWVYRLASPRNRRFLSYATAMISWISAMSFAASACISMMLNTFSIVTLLNPNFNYQRWMGFVGFQAVNFLTVFGAIFEDALPKISKLLLFLTCTSMAVIFVTLFAMSDNHATPKSFFATTVNVSGWQDGIAFIIGLNGANWSLSCFDIITHLAEEIPNPRTNIPKSIMLTVAVGFGAGLAIILAVMINTPVIDGSADNSAITLFYRITGSKAAAVGLWVPVLISLVGAIWGCQTWVSRLAWTLARESGFPLHRHMSKIAPAPFYTPIWSIFVSATIIGIFGCLYLGSEVAFNSLISTSLLLQYISYSIPTILLLAKGRSNFEHGPFWYPKLGFVANLVMLSWSAVALVFYCFPNYSEVIAKQMNYASVILVFSIIFVTSIWFLYAKKHYQVREDVGH